MSKTLVRGEVDDSDKTLVPEMLKNAGTFTTKMSTLTEDLNTMVINSDDTDDEATMKSIHYFYHNRISSPNRWLLNSLSFFRTRYWFSRLWKEVSATIYGPF